MRTAFDRDGITILEGDCAEVLPGIDPASVGLLLTDPPYGINLETDYSAMDGGTTYRPVAGDERPFDPTPLLRFPHLALFGANYYAPTLPLGGWVVWLKAASPEMLGRTWLADAELLWHNRGGRAVEVFHWHWNGPCRKGERGSFLHPTQKPVALMRWLIEKWTQPGDLVLDPYMGSGPIAQACLETRRRYLGVEIDPAYVQTTIEHRLGQATLPLGAC
jgi:site-specific DNA-methyltransferase (adenine-specific)